MSNLDYRKKFSNQNEEHRPEECVAETLADILGNINNQAFDPGFNYGSTFHLTNSVPNDVGLDPYSAFQAQVVYGSLPVSDEDFDALHTSEKYEADFSNYALNDKQLAQHYAMKGIKQLWSYDEIVAYQQRTGWGVGLGMTWRDSFLIPNQDGSLPAPAGQTFNHMIGIYGEEPLGLRFKAWLGPQYGVNGYGFMSRTNLGLTALWPALGFDPAASRWWSLAVAGLTHWNIAGEVLPLLKGASIKTI